MPPAGCGWRAINGRNALAAIQAYMRGVAPIVDVP